jgi:hypothetical protein
LRIKNYPELRIEAAIQSVSLKKSYCISITTCTDLAARFYTKAKDSKI